MKKWYLRMKLAFYRWVLGMYRRFFKKRVSDLQLDMMTVEQLLDSEQFKKELALQLDMEEKHHTEMSYQAVHAGLRLQRAPIQRLMEKGVFNVDDIIRMFKLITCKELNSTFSAAEREYVKRLCMMAYWRVVEKNNKSQ